MWPHVNSMRKKIRGILRSVSNRPIKSARRAMRQEDWQVASRQWSHVRRRFPQKVQGYIAGARALLHDGRQKEAVEVMHDALLRFSDREHVYAAGIELFLSAGETTLALDTARRMAERFDTCVETQARLARLLGRLGHWREARDRYESLAKLVPETAQRIGYRQALIYADGILKANRILPNIPYDQRYRGAEKNLDGPARDKRFLFVSGMPRSGTTALGQLVNLSPDVVLFMELFPKFFPYSPCSFDEEILKMATANDRHGNAGRIEKTRAATYIGDKRPLFHCTLPQTFENFVGHQVVVLHVLRSIRETCLSYVRRAENSADRWNHMRSAEQCIHEINLMNRFIASYHERNFASPEHKFHLIAYERVFSDADYALSIFDLLGLPIRPELERDVKSFIEMSARIVGHKRERHPKVDKAIAERLDLDAVRKVEEIAQVLLI